MKRILTRRLMYRILALILAVLLFAYVKTDKLSTTRISGETSNQSNSLLMSNSTETISIPVELDVNSDKYIVSGYPSKVRVKISGPSALVTTVVNTQNFKVTLPLRRLSAGVHTVKYQTTGLNKSLKYSVTPSSAKITIAERKTETFAIQTRFDKGMVKSGYVVGTPQMSATAVKATGSIDDVNKISQVVADVNIPKGTDSAIESRVLLQALDVNGNIVNVILSPQTVDVTLPISKVQSTSSSSSSKSN